MPLFSAKSLELLHTCHPELQQLFSEVVKYYDCSIIQGVRSITEQEENVRTGRSTTMKSKHLLTPSMAVDVAPFPINWKDTKRFYHFAGFVLGLATSMGINIRWGGDWDMDADLNDQTFFDLVHFELLPSNKEK